MQDTDLLRAYVAERDENAFGELVRRYVDLVYSTALRHVAGESSLAEDVTQSVFLLLAQKANSLQTHPSLAGWLYRTTAHLASRSQRSEERRRAREQEAAQMNNHASNATEIDRILPLLDEGLKGLSKSDREALLLRFFMKRPMQEVGRSLGVSEAAAKMRVGRAVDRLRGYFAQRGISCTSAALALLLAEQPLRAAPVSLAMKVVSSVSSASLATPSLLGTLILMSNQANATCAGFNPCWRPNSVSFRFCNIRPRSIGE